MKLLLSVFVSIHALIHLLGFVKAFNLIKVEQLANPISKVQGMFWLFAFFLFSTSIILYLSEWRYWWVIAFSAIVVSQSTIFLSWKEAKYGSIPNLIILIPIIIAFTGCSSGYYETYKSESEIRLQKIISTNDVVTEKDIVHLPLAVQKYLRYVGAIGKPKVHNFHIVFEGEMKNKIDADWLNVSAQQYEFFGENTRLFYINSSMYGIPFDGLHSYLDDSATMKIKIASLFQIVDAKGEKMTKSETVTLFNDMCLMAPSTLIDSNIVWKEIDDKTVKAIFTNKQYTITAILYFNDEGALINFSSDDRYLSEDGETYLEYKWSTPVTDYKEIEGRIIPTYAEAVWHLPEGEFVYARFRTKEIEYNCSVFK